jgi:hypothetical protein
MRLLRERRDTIFCKHVNVIYFMCYIYTFFFSYAVQNNDNYVTIVSTGDHIAKPLGHLLLLFSNSSYTY